MKLNLVGRRFWLLGHGWVMHGWEWCQEHKYYPNTGWRQPLPGIATKLCSSCLRFIMSLHSWMSSILQKQKKHGQTCKLHPVLMGLARSHLNTWPWPLPGTYEPERQRGSWHSSLTYFNRKQRVFNTKCPLSPWLLVLLGSNLCIGHTHYRKFQMPFAFLNIREHSGMGTCVLGKDRCAILHLLQQQFSLGKEQGWEEQRVWEGAAEGATLFGTARARFIFHYQLSWWPY